MARKHREDMPVTVQSVIQAQLDAQAERDQIYLETGIVINVDGRIVREDPLYLIRACLSTRVRAYLSGERERVH